MAILSEKKFTGLILLFGLVFTGLLFFFNDIKTQETLSDESVQYISDYTSHMETYKIDELKEQQLDESKETSIFIQENETGLFSNVDILGAYNFFNEQWRKISSVAYMIWSFPSFIFSLSGLPIGEVKWIINILGYVLLVAFIYLVRKFISGN